ncbi:MAG: hypothetical protein GTN80_04830, partial [Nitrososphaeria archaeon]|nr:hypothetical protein [Nitrososphaeria archaeon]
MVLWDYYEEPSQAHNTWRHLTGAVEVILTTPDLYLLLGVHDTWIADESQGLKFYFEALILESVETPTITGWLTG